MTIITHRGYIHRTPAKSGVGIGLPDIYSTHTALSGFFMRKARLHPRVMVGCVRAS
ncbi:TPA: hypothetical protein JWK76_002504 [Escherichia coli]|nr:hypothetical protein [Escherichia coli]EFC9842928.1 hypothetical protein [Escherichia coli]EFG2177032.1 hypothetical protein [Escherichia coli]EFJ5712543.1 hypothetical protein [Escherichia coli]EFK1930378.1 hypothetical protein [Escherichia coli]